jgi:hypothetical protein
MLPDARFERFQWFLVKQLARIGNAGRKLLDAETD